MTAYGCLMIIVGLVIMRVGNELMLHLPDDVLNMYYPKWFIKTGKVAIKSAVVIFFTGVVLCIAGVFSFLLSTMP